MRLSRLVGPTILVGFGFFVLSQGIDSLKVEHFGIRLLSVQRLAHTIALSYHVAGIVCLVLGFVFIFAGFKIFNGVHKRVVAANPRKYTDTSLHFLCSRGHFGLSRLGDCERMVYDTHLTNHWSELRKTRE